MPKGTVLLLGKIHLIMCDREGNVVQIGKGVSAELLQHGQRVRFRQRRDRHGRTEAFRVGPLRDLSGK